MSRVLWNNTPGIISDIPCTYNFRELSVRDPEKDMYHCHPNHFWKFSKLRLTSPSGPIRYSILKNNTLKTSRNQLGAVIDLISLRALSQCAYIHVS